MKAPMLVTARTSLPADGALTPVLVKPALCLSSGPTAFKP